MFTNIHKPSYSYIEDNRLFRRIKSLLSRIRSLFRKTKSSFSKIKSSLRNFSYVAQLSQVINNIEINTLGSAAFTKATTD